MSFDCKTAIILVGGYGTRLRPLTLTRPKPLLPFCNKPMITHQIESLKNCGVTKIILATNYRTDDIVREMTVLSKDLNIEIIFSVEQTVLGTGGPLKLAYNHFKDEKCVFVLNSDIVCDYPFEELLTQHKKMNKQCTILTKEVEDPSRFGVILQENNEIKRFIEKPKNFISRTINAGIYIMNTSIIATIPLKEVSLEKEVFTILADINQLASLDLAGYWKDIGQFADFLEAQEVFIANGFYEKGLYEKGLRKEIPEDLHNKKETPEKDSINSKNGPEKSKPTQTTDSKIESCVNSTELKDSNNSEDSKKFENSDTRNSKKIPIAKKQKTEDSNLSKSDLSNERPLNDFYSLSDKSLTKKKVQNQKPFRSTTDHLIDDSATVHPTAFLNKNVVIGANCKIGMGVYLNACTLMAGTIISDYAYIDGSIIGFNSKIDKWCRINKSVLADEVSVTNYAVIDQTIVLPNKTLKESKSNKTVL